MPTAPTAPTAPSLTRYDVTRDALAGLLDGEPSYRVAQVWDGLYRQRVAPSELTNLPKALRQRLDAALPPALRPVTESVSDGGETVKLLWRLADGVLLESVLMHYRDRTTVCISSQAGCAMGCGFCATGQAGFDRQLSTGEIVEQVIEAANRARPRRLGNVVFMGMGEPLANYQATWTAVERLHDDMGISARHITVSTVGIVPGIRRLAAERLPVNLAVSLHAANDELRDDLVPINRRYPLAALAEACRAYIASTRRRLSFEWALIDGTNDRDIDARELAEYARALGALRSRRTHGRNSTVGASSMGVHVNLIPLNPTPGYPTRGSPPARVSAFRRRLAELGVNATVRRNRGADIDAACGQLRANHEVAVRRVERVERVERKPGAPAR